MIRQMKLIYKNQKIKIFSLLLMLVGIVSLGFFVQGCTEDTLDNSKDEFGVNYMSINTNYIDLDVTNITTKFTQTDINTIADAARRITAHMVFDEDSDKYVFQLNSPAEINVSERLFNYVYPGIDMNPKNVLRLKSDCECYVTSGYGYTQTTCYMTDKEIMNFLETQAKIYGWGSIIVGIPGLANTGLGAIALAMGLQAMS